MNGILIAKAALLLAMLGAVIWLFARLLRGGKAGKTFFGSMLLGLASLFLVAIIGRLTTETLHINAYTLAVSSVLGVPGVILMVLIRILWQL